MFSYKNGGIKIMIQVLVVDDDPFIRESMKVILDLDNDLHVAGICRDGNEAAEFVKQHPVDVVLMDIRMPGCDGIEGTKLLKALNHPPAVIILTTFDDDENIVQAIRNGANGYLLKNVPPSHIINGIKTVHEGSMLIHPDIARKLASMLQTPSRGSVAASGIENRSDTIPGLTQAEGKIVRLIADGQSNKEIASTLFLSEGTIKNYITEILGKLELRDRTQIAIFYLKHIYR